MPRSRRSYSPSSRSSSAGPRNHRRPGLKTAAVFIAAVAVASICVHKFWPRGIIHSEKEHWEHSSSPGRRSRRRNAVRDRHNGYIDYDDHNVFDSNDHGRNRRRLPEREYHSHRSRSEGRSRGRDSDSESDFGDYLPTPSERFSERRERLEGDRRGRSRGFGAGEETASAFSVHRDEVIRYEKQSNRSEADRSRIEEERPRQPQYNEAVEDWGRRGQRHSSPSDERGHRGEPVFNERRSKRRSRLDGDYDYY
ncbi:hypothetical protein EsH8_IV_000078 [Colletotrichum jinshuiense]